MTVESATASASYDGNGSTQIFPVPFYFLVDGDIKISKLTGATGVVSTLVLNSDYTLSGAGNTAGGSATLVVAPLTGDEIYIERNVSAVQETAYPANSPFPAASHERALDRLTMLAQQILAKLTFGLFRDPLSESYDAGGNVITNLGTGSADTDAVSKGQMDVAIASAGTGLLPDSIATYPTLASTDADKGAALVGYLKAATGARARTLGNLADQQINLLEFAGADPTGAADSSAAFSNAAAAAVSLGIRRLKLPAGTFKIASKITIALTGISSLSIEGEGMGVTKLLVTDTGGNGIEVTRGAGNWWIDTGNQNGILFSNISILSTGNNLGTAIKINGGSVDGRPGAPIVFDNVEVRAKDQINTQAFALGVHLYDSGGAVFTGCRFFTGGTTNNSGTSVKLECSGSGNDFSGIFFLGCKFTYGQYGVSCGSNIEGLYFDTCSFVGMDQGIHWNAGAESGLNVTNCHFNVNANAINLVGVYDFCLANNLFYGSTTDNATSVIMATTGRGSISGNTFYGRASAGDTAISVASVSTGSQAGITISGNQFTSWATGIAIASSANSVTVGTNGYSNCDVKVSNGSTGSYVAPKVFAATLVVSLTGGAATENVTLPIPSGLFAAAPTVVVATPEGSSANIHSEYLRSSSTATALVLRVFKNDGTNLSSGNARFNAVAVE